jgi:hypothetical protein
MISLMKPEYLASARQLAKDDKTAANEANNPVPETTVPVNRKSEFKSAAKSYLN